MREKKGTDKRKKVLPTKMRRKGEKGAQKKNTETTVKEAIERAGTYRQKTSVQVKSSRMEIKTRREHTGRKKRTEGGQRIVSHDKSV